MKEVSELAVKIAPIITSGESAVVIVKLEDVPLVPVSKTADPSRAKLLPVMA